jgi:hypothetical protein
MTRIDGLNDRESKFKLFPGAMIASLDITNRH